MNRENVRVIIMAGYIGAISMGVLLARSEAEVECVDDGLVGEVEGDGGERGPQVRVGLVGRMVAGMDVSARRRRMIDSVVGSGYIGGGGKD